VAPIKLRRVRPLPRKPRRPPELSDSEKGQKRAERLFDLVNEAMEACDAPEESFTMIVSLVGLIARQIGYSGAEFKPETHEWMRAHLERAINLGFEVGVRQGKGE
jgi:flagellar biosynthesis/type III secretory pathway protein FliH